MYRLCYVRGPSGIIVALAEKLGTAPGLCRVVRHTEVADREERDRMSFDDAEIAYLRSKPLGRLATVGEAGQPDVVPVAFEFDGAFFWVGGSGSSVLSTRKFRNVAAGGARVALVVDDLVSFEPFVARAVRVYGVAEGPVERIGMIGPGMFLRITPVVSWSWNMAGEPVGDTWYEARKVVHAAPLVD